MPKLCFEPGSQCGDYIILNQIGEGAAGEVYEGVSASKDIGPVVIKCVPLTKAWFRKEYEQEVHSLKSFSRAKNVVNLVDNFKLGNLGVLVLEKMNMDLLDYIEQGPIPEDDVKLIFTQVCKAIRRLHRKNVAHLDVKPENIFLNDINTIKLGDFGSCFHWSPENPKKFGASGTSFYCAPEVVSLMFFFFLFIFYFIE